MEGEFHEMTPLVSGGEISGDWDDWGIEPYNLEGDELEMKQLDKDREGEWWETFFSGREVDGPTVTISDGRTVRIRRGLAHRDCEDFFTNVIDLEPQCSQPEFVDHLIDSGVLSIRRVFGKSGIVSDYKVKYLGGDFESIGRTLTGDETNLLRDGIRGHYDEWTQGRLSKTMKKAGIVAAVGLGVIAIVTGLSVGLTISVIYQ